MDFTCAVVLNWRGVGDTLACVTALLAMRPPPRRVVVVDNGSGDGSARVLEAALAGQAAVRLLALPRNVGFAAGCNAAVTAALAEDDVRFFLFCNSDALLRPDALAAFAADAGSRPGVGVFGATVLDAARPGRLQAAGGCRYHPALTIHRPAHAGQPLAAVPGLPEPRLDYIYGACMLVRREVFDRVGLFDPGYFLFCEELDLCRRATRAGFGLGWTREAVAVHAGGASLARGDGPARERAAFVQYHETASALRCVRRHFPAALPVAVVFRWCGKLAVLARRRELHLAGALWAAYRDFFTGQGPVPDGFRPHGRSSGR